MIEVPRTNFSEAETEHCRHVPNTAVSANYFTNTTNFFAIGQLNALMRREIWNQLTFSLNSSRRPIF